MPQATAQPAVIVGTRRAHRVPARPLPDAVAIRALPVPQAAPPYDDALAAPPRPQTGSQARRKTAARPVANRANARGDHEPARTPAHPAGPGDWAGQFAQILAETLTGTRPPGQISAWTTDQARQRISELGPLLAAPSRPRVRRVIVTSPANGVLEMTVIVSLGPRAHALAVRLERQAEPATQAGSPLWRCTEIEAA
jgi:hypothetical protein